MNDIFEQMIEMSEIEDVDRLIALVTARMVLRETYSTLQFGAMATNSDALRQMQDMVAKRGLRINVQIQNWFDRTAMLYGDKEGED